MFKYPAKCIIEFILLSLIVLIKSLEFLISPLIKTAFLFINFL